MTEKQLKLTPTKAGTYYRIEYEGGGQLPEELEGLWDIVDGKNAIQSYCLKKGRAQGKEVKVEIPAEPVIKKPTVELESLG